MDSIPDTRRDDKAVQAAIALVKHGSPPDDDDMEPTGAAVEAALAHYDLDLEPPAAAPELAPMGEHLPADWFTTQNPPREFAFKGILPLDAVSLEVATGGTGKSMCSLELAASVTTGRTLLPGFEPTTGPSRVALLALEDDRPEIHTRLQRIARAFILDFDDRDLLAISQNLKLFCLPTFAAVSVAPDNSIVASPDLKRFAAELAEFKPRMVIADPLAGLLGGAAEENSNEAAQAIVGLLRGAMPPGAALLVLAHTSKADRLTSTTPRGASAWQDAARQVLALRPPDDRESRILGDDARWTVALQVTKSNYSAIPPTLYLQRCLEPEFAGVLKAFNMGDYQNRAEQARTNGLADAVIAALPDFPCTRQEVKGAAETGRAFRDAVNEAVGRHINKADLLTCIDGMLQDGRLTKYHDGKREVLTAGEDENDGILD